MKKLKISLDIFKKICYFYNWDFKFKTIHVVGTNGKGSCCKYINDNLIKNNYKVGLFTSPHLLVWNERIQVNNCYISDEELNLFVNNLLNDFKQISFSWFDLFFLASIHHFHNKKVDVAIFEAGIGAKKDVVNYINHNYLLITSIALDHMELLGNNEYEIAKDKSYAIKNDVITYIPNNLNQDILNLFISKANKFKLNIIDVNQNTFETKNISLVKQFLKNEFLINTQDKDFVLPKGRAEVKLINNMKCILDVSHNVEGIKNCLNFLEKNNINFQQIVVSFSKDKQIDEIIEILNKKNKKIYCFQNSGFKALNINKYPENIEKIYDLKSFINTLKKETLFIGSFYFINDVLLEISK